MTPELKDAIEKETARYIGIANTKLRRNFLVPKVTFDLRGVVAGRAHCGQGWIQYNPILASENGEKFIERTVPHEVAHIVAYLYYMHRIRPHGHEWRHIFGTVFGVKDITRCHSYDVTKARARRRIRYVYKCMCGKDLHAGPKYHSMVMKGVRLRCNFCKSSLRPEWFVRAIDIDKAVSVC
jgi:SprT protein